MTELTSAPETARFIAVYGSAGYSRHNHALLFYERQRSVLRELDRLENILDGDQPEAP